MSPSTASCARTGSVDPLDLSNLVVMEKVARRLQTIEYQHAAKIRKGERGPLAGSASSSSRPAVITCDEMDLFEGRQRVNATACCAPALIEHASKELEKEAQIQKQARKARWERALCRQPRGDGSGGGGGVPER